MNYKMAVTLTQGALGFCIVLGILLIVVMIIPVTCKRDPCGAGMSCQGPCKRDPCGAGMSCQGPHYKPCYQPLKGTGSADENWYCLETPRNNDGTCPQNTLDQSNCNLTEGTYTSLTQGHPFNYTPDVPEHHKGRKTKLDQPLCYQPLMGTGSADGKWYCKTVLPAKDSSCPPNTLDTCNLKKGTYTNI